MMVYDQNSNIFPLDDRTTQTGGLHPQMIGPSDLGHELDVNFEGPYSNDFDHLQSSFDNRMQQNQEFDDDVVDFVNRLNSGGIGAKQSSLQSRSAHKLDENLNVPEELKQILEMPIPQLPNQSEENFVRHPEMGQFP